MFAKPLAQRIRLGDREARDGPPGGATLGKRGGNVEVHMRHGLMSGCPIVLPYSDALGVVGRRDHPSRSGNGSHQDGFLLRNEVKNRLAMGHRDDQDVPPAALLASDQGGCQVVSEKDRVGTSPCEVLAEGTRVSSWKQERHGSILPCQDRTFDAAGPPLEAAKRGAM